MKKSLLFAGLAAATLSFVGCNKVAELPGLETLKVWETYVNNAMHYARIRPALVKAKCARLLFKKMFLFLQNQP